MAITDTDMLDWLEAHPSIQISTEEDEGELLRHIFRVTGNINDREWHQIASADTLRSALVQAMIAEALPIPAKKGTPMAKRYETASEIEAQGDGYAQGARDCLALLSKWFLPTNKNAKACAHAYPLDTHRL